MKKYEFLFGVCCIIAWVQMLLGHTEWGIFSMLFMIFVSLLSIINILIAE